MSRSNTAGRMTSTIGCQPSPWNWFNAEWPCSLRRAARRHCRPRWQRLVIPTVFMIGSDPVELGLVASLNRPGGNLTGVAYLNVEVAPKRLELLHEFVPAAKSIALLVNPANPAAAEAQAKELGAAAASAWPTIDARECEQPNSK